MTKTAEEYERLRKLKADARLLAIDLLLSKGLYSSIDQDDEVAKEAINLIRKAEVGTFDCYCTGCKRETPFMVAPMPVTNVGGGLRENNALFNPPEIIAVRAVCQRNTTTYFYVFQTVGKRLVKIGQRPSMADISFAELAGFGENLPALDRKELGKAIGLFAHDAASGAFVYLRRVFERMIRRAYDRQAERGNPVDGFDGLRVDEKIAALNHELPERVVRNSAVFSVLSVGIHELEDEQCKALFPVLKAVIFQMLEQEEHKRKKEIADRETDAAFQALLSANAGDARSRSVSEGTAS